MSASEVENIVSEYVEKDGEGEVHSSLAPIMLALSVTLCLGGLLIWPLAVLGIPLLVLSISNWMREEVDLWPYRPTRSSAGDWGDASWAMVWIIITECIIFASFFAYWFWARWHTLSWESAVGGSWPATGVEHDIALEKFPGKSLYAAIALGLAFLAIQMYEYSNAGFLWGDHPYGTAFFSLTGLHGLHVLVGLLVFIVVAVLMRNGHMSTDRHDGYRAVTMYWHFVDAVWIVLFLVVYLEVI